MNETLFTYDSENHMMTMSNGGTSVSMVYDGDGNRVAKTVNGVTTQYLVDDLNPTGYPQVFDELTNGAVTRTYTYGLQRIDEEQLVSGSWTTSYYGYDGGGHVRQLTNSAGAVTDTYAYDAYGNQLNHTGNTPNNYRYRGEQFDSDLNLYYQRARWYNPATGRFLSHDPLPGWLAEPITLHRYNYAGVNPVKYIDPSGRNLEEDAVADEPEEGAEAGEEAAGKEVKCSISIDASLVQAAIDYDWSGAETGVVQSLAMIEALPAQCEAENEVDEPKSCPFCFAAGTPVHTDKGDVPIEKIEVGDEVEARNSTSGDLEKEPVTALTPIHKDHLLDIRVEGEQSPLRPSTHHPFWTQRGDESAHWINSAQLRIGDRLLSIDGKWRAITAITSIAGEETVYNFTVDKDHDYFVGETGFLVHNGDPCPCKNANWVPDRIAHVLEHGADVLTKEFHGVFADDPIAMTNEALQEVLAGNATRDFSDSALAFWVDRAEAGLQGGWGGAKAGNPILNRIRVVLNPKNCNVISAYPVQ